MNSRLVFKNFKKGEVTDFLKDPYFTSTQVVKHALNLVGNNVTESLVANDEKEGDIVIWRPEISGGDYYDDMKKNILIQLDNVFFEGDIKKIDNNVL